VNPERAMLFLGDLHSQGWSITLGQTYAVATHRTLGVAQGLGNDLASMVDSLRDELRKRGLAE
jgi:hypothetical protein